MTTKDTIEDKMEQILETFGDRVADKFGGSWDDLSPKAQVELYGEFYDSLLDIFSKALNEARVGELERAIRNNYITKPVRHRAERRINQLKKDIEG